MILALDSSSAVGAAALAGEDGVGRELVIETPRGRGGELFTALETLLRDAPTLSRVVVGLGPGSYNGIRAALAAGWGIAAVQGIPLVGVSSLLGLGKGRYAAAGDARRGQYYFAMIEDGRFIEEPALHTRDELTKKAALLGDTPLFVPAELDFLPQTTIRHASALRLVEIGAKEAGGSAIPEPLYLKPAYINLKG